MDTTIGAGDFKAKCLRLIDDVGTKRQTLLITKRGRPVARLVPGLMMTRSPSRSISTSLMPSKRKALGRRTAWLRPLKNNLAVCISGTPIGPLDTRIAAHALALHHFFEWDGLRLARADGFKLALGQVLEVLCDFIRQAQ